jgi:hypothetical protein
MNDTTRGLVIFAVLILALLVGFFSGLYLGFNDEKEPPKPITVEKTVEVPGPERTVEKTVKEPCETTLPDTGGQSR